MFVHKWYNSSMKTRDKAGLDAGENLNKIESEVERLKHENEELKAKVKFYEEQFRLSQAKKYGPSSDKVLEDQTCLFNEAEIESQKKMEEPDIEEILYKRRKARSKSRKTYEDLEVEEIYYRKMEIEHVLAVIMNFTK